MLLVDWRCGCADAVVVLDSPQPLMQLSGCNDAP